MTDTDTLPQPRSRRPLIIMLAIATLPVVAAYFAYFTGIGVPKETVNAGRFINPVISVENLVGDEMWERFQNEKKWRLLIPVSETCPEDCQTNLYTSRQIHIRLAQNSERLARYAIPLGTLSNGQRERIAADHPRLTFIETAQTEVDDWLALLPSELGDYDYILVDQEGNAMMTYDASIHGNDVLNAISVG